MRTKTRREAACETVTEISEVKKKERQIEKNESIEEKERDRSIDRKREREAINDLNNNAALCIHCHTLALGRHRDCLSDTREPRLSIWFMLHLEAVFEVDSPSSSASFNLSLGSVPRPVLLSLRLCYLHHHVTIKSLLLNLLHPLLFPSSRCLFPALCICLFLHVLHTTNTPLPHILCPLSPFMPTAISHICTFFICACT